MARIYISAGSNQGNRLEYLQMAAQTLSPTVKILRVSPLYETQPWGYAQQANFYNLVWEAETNLPPEGLLRFFKEIEEKRMGRVKTLRYGPRIIDLDILLYDDRIYHSQDLTIPHEEMRKRRFVLQPLCDLIPNEKDPVTGKTWHDLLEECPRDRVERLPQTFDSERTIFRMGLRTYCMGIVNLTPDSFSGDGLYGGNVIDRTLLKCAQLLKDGADMLDLGAESTRPGFQPISADEEKKRLIPILKEVRSSFPKVLISIDSGKAEVVETALNYGIDWVNNTGTEKDQELNRICAACGKPVVLMRSHALLLREEECISSEKLMERVRTQLMYRMEVAMKYGIRRENIIVDPGLGFGGNAWTDLEIVRHLEQVSDLGYPVLLGPSRKSFIGTWLDRPTESRAFGTAAVISKAIAKGADILRVHDVKLLKDVLTMSDLL